MNYPIDITAEVDDISIGLLPQITLKYTRGYFKREKILDASDAIRVLRKCFNPDTIEIFESMKVLFLNRANQTLGYFNISEGGTCSAQLDVKLLFVTAFQRGAHGFILAHNHPSGNLKPSRHDISLSKKIRKQAGFLGFELLDHLILTVDNSLSMRSAGFID